MIRSHYLTILAAAVFALTGCHDTRQETVGSWLQANPPKGFEVAAIPENFTIAKAADGSRETVVAMRYRLTQPTVETRDLFSLPRGIELSKRLAAVRGWALSSLPAGDPTRDSIAAGSSAAREKFPTKHVITPKGTEIETSVTVTLSNSSGNWRVKSEAPVVSAPGSRDLDPNVPFENSPEVAAKFDELEIVTRQLEQLRQKYLVDRQRAAEISLGKLRSLLKTGRAFEGHLPDQAPVRLVISQGADGGNSIVTVVTIQRTDHSSARYTGGIILQPSGEAIWRAAHSTSLSGSTGEPLTDATSHPILTLTVASHGLAAEWKSGSKSPISFPLEPAGAVDLIPEESTQDAPGH